MSSCNTDAGPSFMSFHFGSETSGLSRQQVEAIWATLRQALQAIERQQASSLHFQELYRDAYSLVVYQEGEFLYDQVTQSITKSCQQRADRVVQAGADEVLRAVHAQWAEHAVNMSMVKDVLMYLDKAYCLAFNKRPVYHLGVHLFYQHVLQRQAILTRVKEQLRESVQRMRNQEFVDRDVVKQVLAMLVAMQINGQPVYEEVFERDFLQETRRFYRQEAAALVAENPVADYLVKVEQRVEEEGRRCEQLLHVSTRRKLQRVLFDELITRYCQQLLDDPKSGAQHLFRPDTPETRRDNDDALCRMFRLFSVAGSERIQTDTPAGAAAAAAAAAAAPDLSSRQRSLRLQRQLSSSSAASSQSSSSSSSRVHANWTLGPATKALVSALQKAIIERGRLLVEAAGQGKQGPQQFVAAVLAMRQQFLHYVEHCFESHTAFKKALKDGFEDFLNADARAAECLSQYVHSMFQDPALQRGPQLDARLDNVMAVFRYLRDKDVFEDFYKHQLAQRLLSQRSESAREAEEAMINLLKAECGKGYTSNVEGMLRDVRLNADVMQAYRRFVREQDGSDASVQDFDVSVLHNGFWPYSNQNVPAKLPTAASQLCVRFQQHYTQAYPQRRLVWLHQLGQAEVRARFDQGIKILQVATPQMIVLMLYNGGDAFTYAQLKDLTGLDEAELQRHLLSLSHPKVRILRKTPEVKAIKADDTFAWNTKYACPRIRVKVPVLAKKAAGAQQKGDVSDKVWHQRQMVVQATIVRVMKSRQKLEHNALQIEVIKLLKGKFVPTAAFIKTCVAALLEREFLERDASARNMYHYVP